MKPKISDVRQLQDGINRWTQRYAMEKSYFEYVNELQAMLTVEYLKAQITEVQPLGKFYLSEDRRWRPSAYPGYTLITPTCGDDDENESTYTFLLQAKGFLAGRLNPLKMFPAPDHALHMTVARLISGDFFIRNIQGAGEKDLLSALAQLLGQMDALERLSFVVKGITVFTQGVVAALVEPVDEGSYRRLQYLRDCIYRDPVLGGLGVERRRGFKGHITLFYIEQALTEAEKQTLWDTVNSLNQSLAKHPLPFWVTKAEVRRFNDFTRFCRDGDLPFYCFE